jgi:predicted nucleic acid-binding protein
LAECATLLARRASYALAASWVEDALGEPAIRWLSANRSDLAKAGTLMAKFADQAVSFTDCVSFVLMRRENLKSAFTFDRHFVHAGFSLWDGAD